MQSSFANRACVCSNYRDDILIVLLRLFVLSENEAGRTNTKYENRDLFW